jgi:hypothetical protein
VAKYLLDNAKVKLTNKEIEFLKKYKETRNKVFEHNLDPKEYPLW